MSDQDLALLFRHYSALSPSTPALIPSPPFPSSTFLSLPTTQQYLVSHFISQDSLGSNQIAEGGRQWKKAFWRRIVKGIEEGFEKRREEGDKEVEEEEVHEEILERMVEYLSSSSSDSSAPGLSERMYYWGDLGKGREDWSGVRTREEGRMISGGTTGLRTWQACIALSNHFIASPAPLHSSRNIVELGAGVGLLSLVAARLRGEGGGRIVSTDIDEKVLDLLEGNAELNGLEGKAKISKLDWELASDLSRHEDELLAWESEAFGPDGRADLIIGADIVYDPSLTSQLASTISWLLRPRTDSGQSEAIIAGTIRNESTWELFLSECRSRELRIEDVELVVPPEKSGLVGAEGYENEGEVRVVRLTRSWSCAVTSKF